MLLAECASANSDRICLRSFGSNVSAGYAAAALCELRGLDVSCYCCVYDCYVPVDTSSSGGSKQGSSSSGSGSGGTSADAADASSSCMTRAAEGPVLLVDPDSSEGKCAAHCGHQAVSLVHHSLASFCLST